MPNIEIFSLPIDFVPYTHTSIGQYLRYLNEISMLKAWCGKLKKSAQYP